MFIFKYIDSVFDSQNSCQVLLFLRCVHSGAKLIMRRCVALGALVATALVQTVRADDKNTNINQRKVRAPWVPTTACVPWLGGR